MTVAAAYWISNSLQAVEDILVACPTFATLGMSASNTYWQDARSGPISAPYCVIVMLPGTESEPEANKVPVRTNQVVVYLVWAVTTVGGDTAKDKTKRATNAFGQLMDEVRALVATSTYLVRAVRDFDPPTRTSDKDDQDETPDCWEASITFSWEI